MDHKGSPKFGVVVSDGWHMWKTVLTPLGYQVAQINVYARFRRFLQGGTLGGAALCQLCGSVSVCVCRCILLNSTCSEYYD